MTEYNDETEALIKIKAENHSTVDDRGVSDGIIMDAIESLIKIRNDGLIIKHIDLDIIVSSEKSVGYVPNKTFSCDDTETHHITGYRNTDPDTANLYKFVEERLCMWMQEEDFRDFVSKFLDLYVKAFKPETGRTVYQLDDIEYDDINELMKEKHMHYVIRRVSGKNPKYQMLREFRGGY